MITCYYRISPNTTNKQRICDKYVCLRDFLVNISKAFDKLIVIGDGCDRNTQDLIEEEVNNFSRAVHNDTIWSNNLGNSASFMHAYCIAMSDKSEYIYFAEDDYLYTSGAAIAIREGTINAGFKSFTLYDHPDKYQSLYQYGETCKVSLTKNNHWRTTISTTMTFFIQQKLLKELYPIVSSACQTPMPRDHEMWCEIWKQHQYPLNVCIPGHATHAESRWLSPRYDWTNDLS